MKNIFLAFSKNAALGIIGVIVSSLFVWNTAKAIRAADTTGTSSSSSSVASSESSSVSSASSSSSLSSSVSSSSSSLSSSSSSVSSSSSSSVSSDNEGDDEAGEDSRSSAPAWALKWLNGELHKSETAREHEADHRVKAFKPNQLESIEKHAEKGD